VIAQEHATGHRLLQVGPNLDGCEVHFGSSFASCTIVLTVRLVNISRPCFREITSFVTGCRSRAVMQISAVPELMLAAYLSVVARRHFAAVAGGLWKNSAENQC